MPEGVFAPPPYPLLHDERIISKMKHVRSHVLSSRNGMLSISIMTFLEPNTALGKCWTYPPTPICQSVRTGQDINYRDLDLGNEEDCHT